VQRTDTLFDWQRKLSELQRKVDAARVEKRHGAARALAFSLNDFVQAVSRGDVDDLVGGPFGFWQSPAPLANGGTRKEVVEAGMQLAPAEEADPVPVALQPAEFARLESLWGQRLGGDRLLQRVLLAIAEEILGLTALAPPEPDPPSPFG
jgi:hypothetical protein